MTRKIVQLKNTDRSESFHSVNTNEARKTSPFNFIFILAFLFVIFFCLFSYREIKQLIVANSWVKHTYEVIQAIDTTLYSVVNSETHQRAYLLTGNKQYLIASDVAIANLRKNLSQLDKLTTNSVSQNQRVSEFNLLVQQRLDLINEMRQLKAHNEVQTPEGKEVFDRGQTLSDHIRYLGDEIKAIELELLNQRNAAVLTRSARTNCILIIGNGISLLFLLLAFLLFNRELKRSIRLENKRKNTELRLRSILEGANDMIVAIDQDYHFILFNEAYKKEFKRLFGTSIIIGMSFNDALANLPETKSKLLAAWKASLDGKEYTKNIECKLNHEKNTYEITSNSVMNNQGILIGAIHIIRNVTKRIKERAELQANYKKLNQGILELQNKNQQINMLVAMSDNLLACASQEELNDVVAKYSQRILDFASGFLYVMHPSKNYLEVVASWGNPNAQDLTFMPDQCWAIRRGRLHHVGYSHTELLCNHVKNTENDLSYLCIPLMAQNDIYGLLFMEVQADKFSENTMLLVNAFAELTALALANVRLRENLRYQSIRDPLTSLYNRRYLEDFLFKQIHQAERTESNLGILLLDLDHFKKINDTYGHDAGDLALKEVGRVLENDIRLGDVASRYGGEEFIVIFYNTDGETAKNRAENIRQDVARLQIKYGTQHVGPLTISIGISIYPHHGKTAAELIEAADKALYAAKNSGRNKLVVFGETNSSD